MYEVHLYKDGKVDISDIPYGTGHGEDAVYIVMDSPVNAHIRFKFANGEHRIMFAIPVEMIERCIAPTKDLFKITKDTYVKSDDYSMCVPVVCSKEAHELAKSGKTDSQINNILLEVFSDWNKGTKRVL